MSTLQIPYSTHKYDKTFLIELIIIAIALPIILDIIVSADIFIKLDIGLFIVIGVFITLSIVLYFAKVGHSQKYGEYTFVTISFESNKIKITYDENCQVVPEKEFVLRAGDLCDLKIVKRAKTIYGLYVASIRYMPKEIYDKYHSTFGMYGRIRLGVPTKEQWEILRKEIEEFKKRNNITGCKSKKGRKS